MKPSPETSAARPGLSSGRRWLFRVVLLALVLVVPLGLAEVGLRLAGYGYETEFLLERTVNGRRVFVDNPRFAYRFFPQRIARNPQTTLVDAEKPAGTVRVVVLGESAALGDPEPAYGLPRQLGVVLPARFPGKKFEVINVAMTAINSHAFPDIARSAAKLQPDFWVIYAGNNEFMGPFGPASTGSGAGRPRWLIRLALAAQTTRTGQWLAAFASRLSGSAAAGDTEFAGLETFLSQRINPDAPGLQTAYDSFRANLNEVIDVAKSAGATVVLAAPAVNLRDSGPFASAGADLTADLEDTSRLVGSNLVAEAITKLETLTKREPLHAGAHYALGRAYLSAGRTNEVLAPLARARDLDALKFRADSRLIAVCRELAASRAGDGVIPLDAEAAFSALALAGAPGNETFWEHVHFSFEGTLRLANFVADALAAKLGQAGPPTTRDVVLRELAITEWNQARVVDLIRARIQRPPFNQRPNAAEQEALISGEAFRLRPSLQINTFERHSTLYRAALERRTNDWLLRDQFAKLLLAFGDRESAVEQWRLIVAQVPHHLMAHYQLGDSLSAAPATAAEAETHLRAALALREDFPEAWDRLGQALGHQKKLAEAEVAFARALELRPGYTEARVNRSVTLAAAGRTNDAIGIIREAVARDTNSPLAWQQLGRLLTAKGEFPEAAAALENASQLRPQNFASHYQAAEAWHRANRLDLAGQHWLEAVKLNPDSVEARYFLALELGRQRQFEVAAGQFREVIQRKPDWASPHLNLGVALMQLNRPEEALAAFDRAVELDPKNQQARTYASSVREQLRQGQK